MTQIRVGETVYSLEDSVNGAALGDLYALKVQTRKDGSAGVSVKTISDTFVRIGEAASEPGFNTLSLLDDAEFIQNFIGVAFLARRKAGEQVTFEDAGRVSFNDLQIIPEVDEESDADPKGEGDAGEV